MLGLERKKTGLILIIDKFIYIENQENLQTKFLELRSGFIYLAESDISIQKSIKFLHTSHKELEMATVKMLIF